MSLITSCPACGTMFRVVPDQLKISEGWVRCGHCSEVFDASAHLSDESILGALPDAQGTTSAALSAPPPPPPAPAPSRQWAADQPTMPAELKTRPAELYSRSPATAEEHTSSRSDDPSDFFLGEEADPGLEPSPLDAPFVFRRSELALSDLGPEPGRESQMLPEDFDGQDEEPVPNVSFVRQARRRACRTNETLGTGSSSCPSKSSGSIWLSRPGSGPRSDSASSERRNTKGASSGEGSSPGSASSPRKKSEGSSERLLVCSSAVAGERE